VTDQNFLLSSYLIMILCFDGHNLVSNQ